MELLQEGGAELKWQPRCHGLADWGRLAKKTTVVTISISFVVIIKLTS